MDINVYELSKTIGISAEKLSKEMNDNGFKINDLYQILEKEERDFIFKKYSDKILEHLVKNKHKIEKK